MFCLIFAVFPSIFVSLSRPRRCGLVAAFHSPIVRSSTQPRRQPRRSDRRHEGCHASSVRSKQGIHRQRRKKWGQTGRAASQPDASRNGVSAQSTACGACLCVCSKNSVMAFDEIEVKVREATSSDRYDETTHRNRTVGGGGGASGSAGRLLPVGGAMTLHHRRRGVGCRSCTLALPLL